MRGRAARPSLRSPHRDVGGEVLERAEYLHVLLVAFLELEAVALRDDEGDLEDVDRVEAEAFLVERRFRVDLGGGDLEVERRDDQAGDLPHQGGIDLRSEERRVGKEGGARGWPERRR